MIRVYFVFEDPLDEEGVNLSFVDVPTHDPSEAFARVEGAAESGGLWEKLYPGDQDHPYRLISSKMMYLDISGLPQDVAKDTVLVA